MTTLFDLTEFEASILECVDNPDLIGDEDPAYITPRLKHEPEPAPHHHWWRAYMRTDVEMTWVCDCGETKTDLSQREYIELWQRHSADMLSSLEAAIASPTGHLVKDYFRHVSIEADILRYIVPNLPDFLPADKTVAAAIAPNPEPEPTAIDTIRGGYVEEKVINGRVYRYQRWREDGKLRSKYLGSKDRLTKR